MSATAKKLSVLGAVLLGAVLSGCISFSGHFGTEIRVEHIPRIEEGVTTREEVMSWFGPPSAFFNPTFLDVILGEEDEMMDSEVGLLNDVFTYRYIENKSTLLFVPILVGFVDTVAVSETLTIFFDKNGRVKYHAYRRDVPRPRKGD
jgi:outer membrane protein assembly factor BamE (lipoprotein component of BamABCDE complex)